jgi:hypothetical protein
LHGLCLSERRPPVYLMAPLFLPAGIRHGGMAFSPKFPGSSSNGMKLGKAKREGYHKFRYLQFNNVAILTLFRA